MTINEKKCVNNRRKISFLGHTISKEDTSPDRAMIAKKKKKKKIATSTNKKELESFGGIGEFL